jgi:hypothetical protein
MLNIRGWDFYVSYFSELIEVTWDRNENRHLNTLETGFSW